MGSTRRDATEAWSAAQPDVLRYARLDTCRPRRPCVHAHSILPPLPQRDLGTGARRVGFDAQLVCGVSLDLEHAIELDQSGPGIGCRRHDVEVETVCDPPRPLATEILVQQDVEVLESWGSGCATHFYTLPRPASPGKARFARAPVGHADK